MSVFEDIKIGDSASFTKTVGETDLYLFCGISGDFNPLHINQIYATKAKFGKGRLVHGLLVASFISNVLGTKLPGPGTVYISQNLRFMAPVYVGDTVQTVVEVMEKIEEKRHFVLRTYCVNQEGVRVIDGEAKVLLLQD